MEKLVSLIKQIYWFLKYKILSQKFLICVKGSDLVYLNDIENIDSFLVKLREKAYNPLVKAIFEDHENDREFLSDRVDNVISNSEYKYFRLQFNVLKYSWANIVLLTKTTKSIIMIFFDIKLFIVIRNGICWSIIVHFFFTYN